MAAKAGVITITTLFFLTIILGFPIMGTSDNNQPECPYPCYPPPTSVTNCPPPPPSQPATSYPPPPGQPGSPSSYYYPPPSGYLPYYPPPSGYLPYNPPSSSSFPGPPPPNPILPYFPFYYRTPQSANSAPPPRGSSEFSTFFMMLPLIVLGLLHRH